MEECHDPATLVREFWSENPHLKIDAKRVLCQTTDVSVVVMAVGREVVALIQIGYHVTDPFAVDVA